MAADEIAAMLDAVEDVAVDVTVTVHFDPDPDPDADPSGDANEEPSASHTQEETTADVGEHVDATTAVGDLEGVGTSTADRLSRAGFATIADVAQADLNALADVHYVGQTRARQLQHAARSLLTENDDGGDGSGDEGDRQPVFVREDVDPNALVDALAGATSKREVQRALGIPDHGTVTAIVADLGLEDDLTATGTLDRATAEDAVQEVAPDA